MAPLRQRLLPGGASAADADAAALAEEMRGEEVPKVLTLVVLDYQWLGKAGERLLKNLKRFRFSFGSYLDLRPFNSRVESWFRVS